MFNFNQLEVVKDDSSYSSFVGIRKDKDSNAMVFNLPKGFNDFEVNYNNVKTLFFTMYQTFKIFFEQKQQRSSLIDTKPQSKDHISINNDTGAYQFTDSSDNEVLLYSKLDIIDDIIKIYNDLEIESLIQEVGLVDDIDYSKIDTLINNGVFLKNNAIIVENMVDDKNIIKGIPSDLIELYCYIYKEILTELGETINDRITEIAYNFTHKHLTSVQSLFDEFTFDSTTLVLKDCLDIIDKNTAYKDFVYWDIFEAVDNFLYGSLDFDSKNDKGFWGINNFNSIWEDMCNLYFSKVETSTYIFCDTDIDLSKYRSGILVRKMYDGRNKVYHEKGFENNFKIEFKGAFRWMRPDLIIKPNYSEKIAFFLDNDIITYKTSSIGLFTMDVEFDLQISKHVEIQNHAKNKFANILKHFKKVSKSNKEKFFVKELSKNKFKIQNINQKSLDECLNTLRKLDEINISEADVYSIDWKYVGLDFFKGNSEKLSKDVIKQLTYELCLSKNKNYSDQKIQSQFGIPCYFNNNNKKEEYQHHSSVDGIKIMKVNFNLVQEVYLNEYRI